MLAKPIDMQCLVKVVLALFSLFCFSYAEGEKIIDLSFTYSDNITYLPQYQPFKFTTIQRGMRDGFWLELNMIQTIEHAGTHIDAPRHFNKDGLTVDQISLHDLIAPGVVIDITEKAMQNPMAKLTVEDIQNWEEENGEIPVGAVVIVRSGWGKKMHNRSAYLGLKRGGAPGDYNYPGIRADAARWLIDERNIVGVGIDTLSIDGGKLGQAETHRTLLGQNKYALENLARLEDLPPRDFTLLTFPMKIGGGSGSPARVIAVMGECGELCSGANFQSHLSWIALTTSLVISWLTVF